MAYIIQSRPDDTGRREFYRTNSPELPTIKVGVSHGWEITSTTWDIDREKLIASGAERLGTSPWLNLSSSPCDPTPGAFTEEPWMAHLLSRLEP